MSLTDRLAQSANSSVGSDTDVVPARENELDELKVKYHYTLVNELGPELDDTGTGREALKSRVEQILRSLLAIETMPLSSQDKEGIIRDVIDNILGYGPIEQFLKDQDITEVMVNNADSIYIERAGKIYKTDRKFLDEDHLLRIIDKIVSQVGRRIDESSPMVDARLPDGSRVNAVIHPLAINGPMLTIRKFSKDPFTVDDLIRFEP